MPAAHFLEIEPSFRAYASSHFVVVPVPHEATTSYGKGTKKGPAAILSASQQVETFDEELQTEPYKRGIHTLKPVKLAKLQSQITKLLDDNKFPVILGGEHSITPVAVKAFAEKYPDLSVLQLDAHADLRDRYRGSGNNHACVMRRVLEICPAVQAGIRSLSPEEWEFAKQSGQLEKIHWARKLDARNIVHQLKPNVYITLDVDVFDPSVIPATGTPEPGGLLWHAVLEILKAVCSTKKVVGFDVVELSPRKGDIASDFTVARLVYKMMGYVKLAN